MSLASERLDYTSSSTPSPDILSKKAHNTAYQNCYYRNGKYCCSKICSLTVPLIFTSLAGLMITSLALYFDNWAGISTNPEATLDLPYPRLGPKYLDYIIFNTTIPNDNGTLYQYIDEARTSVRFITSRFGLFSQCKSPTTGPKISLFQTPWKAPVCKASGDEYQCPIVAMRITRGSEPRAPRLSRPISGCIKQNQVCDGNIDCPSGHDEVNCPNAHSECGSGMVQCSANKHICILKSQVCNGINDCGMWEDEQQCCGRVGFIRCGDGSCVLGERCDAKSDCFDLSDEYNCPDPSSKFLTKCRDGQLIESTYLCEHKTYPSFQCNDLSDETRCESDPQPLPNNPGLSSLQYDKAYKCFKQAFTFTSINESTLKLNYPDQHQRKFAQTYEFSILRFVIVIGIGIAIFLSVLSSILLLSVGSIIKRCRSMRILFICLSVMYAICLFQTLLTGLFWLKYVDALNEVMENPTEYNIYRQVAIETIRVTGGLATIRISTHLTFYNSGFFGLAMLLSMLAAHLLKKASCHSGDDSMNFEKKYRRNELISDPLSGDTLLIGSRVPSDSTQDSDVGIATPNQIVSPQRSFRSLDKNYGHSASDTALRVPYPFCNGSTYNGSTYISYKDPNDTIERSDTSLFKTRTLDRPIKYTQV